MEELLKMLLKEATTGERPPLDQLIKLAPEGTPEYIVYHATGLNPLELWKKDSDLSEHLPIPTTTEESVKNTKAIIDTMVNNFSKEELAVMANYAILKS